jgi:TPR repeat protein
MPVLFALAMLASLAPSEEIATWRDLIGQGKNAEALAAVEKSAATGDPDALDFVGWFYDEGRGVAVDKVKAAMTYRRAAEAGQKHAQWRLGVMLDKGEGVASDPHAAFEWFLKSAAQGFTNAYVSLGVMYSTGRGVAQDYAKALTAYREGARRGNVHAFNEIGVAYLHGEGVAADRQEAVAWFIIAATSGDSVGQRNLQLAGSDMTKADLDRAAARASEISREYELNHVVAEPKT